MPLTLVTPLKEALTESSHYHCNCWAIERSDGFSFACTDHNERLTVAGYGFVFEPAGGWGSSARERQTTLQDENLEIQGVLSSESITDADLWAGKFSNASITHLLVDWRVPQYGPISVSTYTLPGVSYTSESWQGELVGLTGKLKPKVGSSHTRNCPYDFGDTATCKVDLGALSYYDIRVASVTNKYTFTAYNSDIPGSLGDDFFNLGKLSWSTGPNAGAVASVQDYTDSTRGFILNGSAPFAISVGDTFHVSRGCDKRVSTCNGYSNIDNFGGSPFLPGTDSLVQRADQRR